MSVFSATGQRVVLPRKQDFVADVLSRYADRPRRTRYLAALVLHANGWSCSEIAAAFFGQSERADRLKAWRMVNSARRTLARRFPDAVTIYGSPRDTEDEFESSAGAA